MKPIGKTKNAMSASSFNMRFRSEKTLRYADRFLPVAYIMISRNRASDTDNGSTQWEACHRSEPIQLHGINFIRKIEYIRGHAWLGQYHIIAQVFIIAIIRLHSDWNNLLANPKSTLCYFKLVFICVFFVHLPSYSHSYAMDEVVRYSSTYCDSIPHLLTG